jgi:hypothetical protein
MIRPTKKRYRKGQNVAKGHYLADIGKKYFREYSFDYCNYEIKNVIS